MKMIDKMVSAFLGWKLPKDFAPDAGISLDRAYGDKWGMPSGTNLFHAEQAREMIQHMLTAAEIDQLVHERDEQVIAINRYRQEFQMLVEEREEALKTVAWVCRKLGLPEGTKLLSGKQTIAGTMHCVCADAHGYKAYIEAWKCDDKQGEIARLTHERDALREERDALAAIVQSLCKAIDPLLIGSCQCMTKTPAASHHKPDCRYRVASFALQEADRPDVKAILAARDARTKAAALRDACDAWVATGAFSGERTQRIVADWLLTRANEIDKESSNG